MFFLGHKFSDQLSEYLGVQLLNYTVSLCLA